jgi:hypothetical protein
MNLFDLSVSKVYLNQRTKAVPNVILVDWSPLASDYYYPRAALHTHFVGDSTAQLIQSLVAEGLTSVVSENDNYWHCTPFLNARQCKCMQYFQDKIHIVGHSLGAHVAGFTGKGVTLNGLGKISEITGFLFAYMKRFENIIGKQQRFLYGKDWILLAQDSVWMQMTA